MSAYDPHTARTDEQQKLVYGWLEQAVKKDSPNCDDRPEDESINLLVIHNISLPPGQFGGDNIERLFTNTLDMRAHPFFAELRDRRLSAHFLIARRGELTQFVPLHRRAWHAGVSSFQGRENCNDFSIGIELEGTDETPYNDIQYERLVELTLELMRRYPGIVEKRIVGHCDIAPGRKTDPGASFDWARYRKLLQLRRAA